MKNERRKLWKFNLSPGNWIAIVIFIFGLSSGVITGAVSYVRAMDKIDANSDDIQNVRKEMTDKLDETKKALSEQIRASESRTRGDIRELRQIMLRK